MPVSNGLRNSLNRIREISSEIYHQYVPVIDENTDIGSLATPVLTVPEVYNEFCSALIMSPGRGRDGEGVVQPRAERPGLPGVLGSSKQRALVDMVVKCDSRT